MATINTYNHITIMEHGEVFSVVEVEQVEAHFTKEIGLRVVQILYTHPVLTIVRNEAARLANLASVCFVRRVYDEAWREQLDPESFTRIVC